MPELPLDQHRHTLLVEETHDPAFRRHLQAQVRAYNQATSMIRGPDARPLLIKVRDADGQPGGGIVATTYWDWLVIDLLIIDEHLRGRGIGRQVLLRAEQEARRRGCTNAHTSTYGFQALPFYQHLQYAIIGQLAEYPTGYTLYWLRKQL